MQRQVGAGAEHLPEGADLRRRPEHRARKQDDDHQLLNARELERLGAAEVLTEDELTPALLSRRVRDFLDDRKRAERLAGNLEPLRTERAAEKIADLCFTLMKDKAQE
ncbi:MAG: hypothetical protein MUP19_07420 [Candidatus Aminicenantes bacterium]|nr:hypothetical protein [Candidatus Aminicenantes bacterium]